MVGFLILDLTELTRSLNILILGGPVESAAASIFAVVVELQTQGASFPTKLWERIMLTIEQQNEILSTWRMARNKIDQFESIMLDRFASHGRIMRDCSWPGDRKAVRMVLSKIHYAVLGLADQDLLSRWWGVIGADILDHDIDSSQLVIGFHDLLIAFRTVLGFRFTTSAESAWKLFFQNAIVQIQHETVLEKVKANLLLKSLSG